MTPEYLEIAKLIDHSLLQPNLTVAEMEAGIDLAIKFNCASVCIVPSYVKRASERLAGTGVFSSTTIGFPHGAQTSEVKIYESDQAIGHGAQELDVVINIGRLKSGDWRYVRDEISELTTLTHDKGAKIKVIFENAYLTDEEKIQLCKLCSLEHVDWVKTSTGYAPTGATFEDIALMRAYSDPAVEVKAAGGIRDIDTLLQYKELGVTRVGASRTAEILNSWRERIGLEPIEATTTTSGY